MNAALSQFRDAIRSAGLTPPEVIEADGKLRRFASNGKRSDDAGWYLLHGDGIPAGSFGDWRTGFSQTWRADVGRKLTQAEEGDHLAKVEAMRRQRDAEEKARHAEAMKKAAAIWQEAQPAPDNHPYLVRKHIEANGARLHNGVLLIPMRDGVELHSLQFITPEGDKRFLTGGRVQGCYFAIGKPDKVLCIAEGFATGASIFEAAGYPVAVAFNAGNLEQVARALRAKLPDLRLILCADDDYRTKGNPGIAKATEAARSVGGLVAAPDFGIERPEGATDFNDLRLHRGADAVKRAIDNATVPAKGEALPSAGISSEGEQWPDPLPLPEALPPVKTFDVALLPDSLRPWIVDIAERVQCPPDFVAVGAMISLAAVVGRKIGIRPKRRDDWLEVPNLWGAIIGRPGVLKSPALREAMRPLRRLEAREAEAFKDEAAAWQQQRELAKLKREVERSHALKALKGNVNASVTFSNDISEDEPQARRYVVNDCSYQALGVILQYNPNGTLAYRDEIVGLLKSLDEEGNESARGFFLTAWNGTEGYTFDRIGRGLNQRIEACCLSLLGSIQPAVIGGYLRQAVAGAGDDGLLSRFQLMVWPDLSAEWRDVDRWPETEARARANQTFDRLDTLDPQAIGATLEDGGIPFLRFDEAAQELFSEWRATLEQRLRSGEDHPAVESHLAKYRKLVPALALLIHLADHPGGAVGEVALLKSLAWAEYLESHARRAYASVTQAEAESARALLYRIRRGEVLDPFVGRDVYLKHWARLSKPEEVHEAVRLLTDLDYLRKEEQATGGRPKGAIWINPKARQA
jgi:putative DNA primase/helicase